MTAYPSGRDHSGGWLCTIVMISSTSLTTSATLALSTHSMVSIGWWCSAVEPVALKAALGTPRQAKVEWLLCGQGSTHTTAG